jgi:hypothetical protein
MKKSIKVLAALMLAVMLMVSTYSFAVLAYEPAAPPAPSYIVPSDEPPTIVDGDRSEWDLASDFFANMYEAGDPDKDLLSKLYLRYMCPDDPNSGDLGVLYALVLAEEDLDVHKSPADAFIKEIYDPGPPPDQEKLFDGNSGNDGTPPDFAWVEIDPDNPDPSIARGWEGSAYLGEGIHYINVHVQVVPNRTSAVENRYIELVITCKETAITLPSTSFAAQVGAGSVTLTWETGTEVDNAGFNLYRALLEDGPYTQINEALIAAQGDAVAGASYSFLDAPDYGTFYYKLEDVDYYGVGTLHGPVKVTVARPLRRPLYRPRLPEF